MPELPEVETYRRYLESTALHQPIEAIDVEDTKLLTTPYADLVEGVVGHSFTGTRRVGKNLFVYTDGPFTVRMHFGMTGDLEYYHQSRDRPRHARIVFSFKGGYNMGFICPRKFERVGLVTDVDAFLREKKIAEDALSISLETLTAHLRKRKSPIKPTLLDQSTVAGIGNWIVDEVLYQAKIHPERIAATLTDDEIERLHAAMRYVLETAIAQEAHYGHFPKEFIIHAREWSTSPYDEADRHRRCPCGKVEIAQSRVGGRATYFCPVCQVL
jgi:formamidopyrimidine-DNA glycosylase